MRRQSNHLRYLSAAGVLALGTACAANVYMKPPTYQGPDPARLSQLATRVASASPADAGQSLPIPPARHYQPVSVSAAPSQPPRPVKPVSTTPKPATEAPKPAETKPTPEAAVKQIALMGVTQQGEAPTAWLVDISTHERETVGAGESAFGFTVKEIGAESVLLAQAGEEFTVRMGDKEIPVTEAETPHPTEASSANQNDGGQGRWGRRGFAGFNRGGGGNWSGRWSGGGGGNWSGGSGNRNWGGNRSFSSNFSRPSFGGNFGGNFGGQSFNQGGNQNNNQTRATANPQEARRRGSRLIGGAAALPTPAAIRNPQTSRRRGTNSGRAFGSDPNWR